MQRLIYRILFYLFALLSILALEVFADQIPKIRSVYIEVQDIFLPEGGKDVPLAWQAVNSLKINTKERIVRRKLLFAEGDDYQENLLLESERVLRNLSYLTDVYIVPTFDGHYVDIVVYVRDTWTLFPALSFNIGDAKDKSTHGLVESNLAGFGKTLKLLRSDDRGRDTKEVVFKDPNFYNLGIKIIADVFDRSDGHEAAFFVGHPFTSLVEKSSWGISVEELNLVDSLFDQSTETFAYRKKMLFFKAGAAFTLGDLDSIIQRFSIYYCHKRNRFYQATDKDLEDADINSSILSRDPSLLADNRRYSGLILGYQRIVPDYLSVSYIDSFNRIQDFNMGPETRIQLWASPTSFGSKRNSWMFSASQSKGQILSLKSFMHGGASFEGILEKKEIRNHAASLEGKYLYVPGSFFWGDYFLGKHTFVASLMLDISGNLYKDRQLLLGAKRGLRGYKSRSFSGNKRLLLNLEQRIHLFENVMQLIDGGLTVFCDVGGVNQGSVFSVFDGNLYPACGLGLRLGSPRSGGVKTLNIDMAFPMRNGPDGVESFSPRLVVSTGQIVKSKPRSELGLERVSTTSLLFD